VIAEQHDVSARGVGCDRPGSAGGARCLVACLGGRIVSPSCRGGEAFARSDRYQTHRAGLGISFGRANLEGVARRQTRDLDFAIRHSPRRVEPVSDSGEGGSHVRSAAKCWRDGSPRCCCGSPARSCCGSPSGGSSRCCSTSRPEGRGRSVVDLSNGWSPKRRARSR
jgi:hypothetical protein